MGDIFRGIDTCSGCSKDAADKEEAAHFARLDKMTVEERLRELEEISYRRSKAKPVYVPSPLIGGG